MWYWEYIVQIWNDLENRYESNAGLVVAEDFSEAMESIDTYYGEELCEVHMLKPVEEGEVFDFTYTSPDCDFVFKRKE